MFEQCAASLKRLGTDYIDLYQCHRADEASPLIETCRAMNDLINQGKTLYWGVSEWNADQIAEAVAICDDHHWHRPVSDQPLYNMLERHWEADAFPHSSFCFCLYRQTTTACSPGPTRAMFTIPAVVDT